MTISQLIARGSSVESGRAVYDACFGVAGGTVGLEVELLEADCDLIVPTVCCNACGGDEADGKKFHAQEIAVGVSSEEVEGKGVRWSPDLI